VVLTSRDSLAGLVARDGAARLDLDVLPLTDAVALLRALIGPRVDAEPDAAARLARQCCRLPLALRVAAELAASHPTASLAHLADELVDLSTRLELLEAGGDPRTQVRVVFSWSYRHLDTEAAGTFRLLGLQPGPDIDPYAAAALAGTSVPQARQVLEMLARANLISLVAPGRYGMHDLLRGYARELASSLDSARQHAALTRLFDYYLHTAAAAMDRLLPAERRCRPRVPSPATPTPLLADPGAARQWLDRERATLVAVAGHAAAHGWPAHATRLAATLARYLRNGAHFPEALAVFSHALDAARRVGDRVAEAAVLNQLGLADWQLSRFQQATDNFRQALALFRAEGDRAGEGYALGSMGLAETTLCRYEQAAIHQQEAVAIFREAGDRFGEAWALGLLGHARRGQGRYQEAASYCRQSLDLSREIGDQEGGAWSLARLGVMDLRLGRHESAAGYFRQALAVFEEIGSTVGVAEIMGRLGEADLKLGRYEQAAGNFEQALAMSRDIGDRALQADALIGLGEARLHAGDAAQARAHHAAALRLASEASVPAVQARAHRGLATACQAAGDLAQARRHWQEALTRYAAIGAPEASEIRGRLATADGNGDQARTEE
jgi:tetratricopeptide (TPR) repeat protein